MNLEEIRSIAVVGAGLMGHGIAQEFAVAGYEVTLVDTDEAVLSSAVGRIRDNLRHMVELELVDSTAAADAPERVATKSDLTAAVSDVDVVIEAASENLELKQRLFGELDRICRADTILSSNSSTFMPSQINVNVERRDRVLVTHYFNPPHFLPIVEVVRGPETSPETVETMFALLERIGKRPAIVNKEAPGFIGNRLQYALFREALSIVEQGIASVEDVDTVVRFGFGRRLAAAGPFEIVDAAGADLWYSIAENLLPDISRTTDVPDFYREMQERGEFGMKSGKGFLEWTPESAAAVRDRIARSLAATSQLLDR